MTDINKSRSIKRVQSKAVSADAAARTKAEKKANSPTVDSFVNFSHKLGIGADSPLSSATYGFNPVTRIRNVLEWIHRGSWLGGVAIDVVADDMTREGVEIKGSLDPKEIEKLGTAAVRLQIWNEMRDNICWSRLYGGSLAVMLMDGQDPSTPLRMEGIRKGSFKGLLVLDRWMVEPSLNDLVTELGPDLGLPKFYRVTADAPALPRRKIHHSRCIRLGGLRLPYWQRIQENLWGLSVIERLYDRLVMFDSATTGAAQLVYKAYIRTYKIKDMRGVIAQGGDAQAGLVKYVEMMRKFQGIEGITLIDGEDDFSADSHGAFSGLSDTLQQFAQQLSGALQIPLVRLFGQSPVGFSTGDSDLRNYYDNIKQQQVRDLGTGTEKIYRVMAASEGIKLPEDFALEFKSLWQLEAETKSTIASNISSSVSSAENSGLIKRSTALKELKQSSHVTGIFSNITDRDITDAETEEAQAPPGAEELIPGEIKDDPLTLPKGATVEQLGDTEFTVRTEKGTSGRYSTWDAANTAAEAETIRSIRQFIRR